MFFLRPSKYEQVYKVFIQVNIGNESEIRDTCERIGDFILIVQKKKLDVV